MGTAILLLVITTSLNALRAAAAGLNAIQVAFLAALSLLTSAVTIAAFVFSLLGILSVVHVWLRVSDGRLEGINGCLCEASDFIRRNAIRLWKGDF